MSDEFDDHPLAEVGPAEGAPKPDGQPFPVSGEASPPDRPPGDLVENDPSVKSPARTWEPGEMPGQSPPYGLMQTRPFDESDELMAPAERGIDEYEFVSPEARLDDLESRWDDLIDILKRTGMVHDDHLKLLRRPKSLRP